MNEKSTHQCYVTKIKVAKLQPKPHLTAVSFHKVKVPQSSTENSGTFEKMKKQGIRVKRKPSWNKVDIFAKLR